MIILILKRYFYVFFVEIERFFQNMKYRHSVWSVISIFSFYEFFKFSRVYMKYCMCEFIVKSKNNLKNCRPRRDQFRITLWTTLWELPWDGPGRTDLWLPFKWPFGDHPRISPRGLFWGNPRRVDLPSFLFGILFVYEPSESGKILLGTSLIKKFTA